MTWGAKYPLNIIVGGDSKESGLTKVKNEFTSLYGELDTHAHDGTANNGPKITAANVTNVAAGNIVATDVQAAINELDTEKLALAGGTLTGLLIEKKGADIASASTINLSTATGNFAHITGTTPITAITMTSGQRMTVIFDGALTLTHHATNNNLPGGANIPTAAGDRAEYWSDGTTVYCTKYQKANGAALLIASSAEAIAGTDDTKTLTPLQLRNGLNASGDAPVYACRAWVNFNGAGTVAIRAAGNVTSITDNGTGDYTLNFTTAIQDANYAANVNASETDGTRLRTTSTYATGSFRFLIANPTTAQDVVNIDVVIFR